jgi:hypothetical protein
VQVQELLLELDDHSLRNEYTHTNIQIYGCSVCGLTIIIDAYEDRILKVQTMARNRKSQTENPGLEMCVQILSNKG